MTYTAKLPNGTKVEIKASSYDAAKLKISTLHNVPLSKIRMIGVSK